MKSNLFSKRHEDLKKILSVVALVTFSLSPLTPAFADTSTDTSSSIDANLPVAPDPTVNPTSPDTSTSPAPSLDSILPSAQPDQTTQSSDQPASTPSAQSAQKTPSAPSLTPSAPPPTGITNNAPTAQNPDLFSLQNTNPKVDGVTGALTQHISLDIPPGRSGLRPDLALDYNSQNTEDSIVGYGWSVSIPYIQRLNKNGSQNLYNPGAYFTSSLDGELSVASVATSSATTSGATLTVLVVGGGGGGGGGSTSDSRGGGGGAGGFQAGTYNVFSTGTYSVTVGGGGSGGTTAGTDGSGGGASAIVGVVTSDGGGGGGSPFDSGLNGASGGGGGGGSCHSPHSGGSGEVGQGNNGGQSGGSCSQASGGGGGGASSVGSPDTLSGGTGAGGSGTSNSISGSSLTYAVGGNAGGASGAGSAGGANTGNGGNGGFGIQAGGNGGSGIVIISYLTSAAGNYSCGGTTTTSGSSTICTYTSNGNFTISTLGVVPITVAVPAYIARVDNGSFHLYSYATSTNTWTMYDKNGTRYLFGATTQSQMSATTSPSQVYKWMLEEVRDTNNNYIKYTYTKDGNQIYPSQIIYTGNGTTDGPTTITFNTVSRPDPYNNYKAGFKVSTNNRISQISAAFNGTTVRQYDRYPKS